MILKIKNILKTSDFNFLQAVEEKEGFAERVRGKFFNKGIERDIKHNRKEDIKTKELLSKINHKETKICAITERAFLKTIGGDCETAVGVHAVVEGDEIILEAELFSLDGNERFYEKKSSKIENAKILGKEVGQMLKTKSNNSYKR